jgi:hypothetical protein
MITGMHAIIYSKDADADRAFFRDVLSFSSVDVGGGWLIFATPPAEVALHPADANDRHELFLMCSDVDAENSVFMNRATRSRMAAMPDFRAVCTSHAAHLDNALNQGWGRCFQDGRPALFAGGVFLHCVINPPTSPGMERRSCPCGRAEKS